MTIPCPPHSGKSMTEMNTGERIVYQLETYNAIMGTIVRGRVATGQRTVSIPARSDHDGFCSMQATVDWICPQCGGPRGEVFSTISYDGSRRLVCDGWNNPCGHIDKYSAVREEHFENMQVATTEQPPRTMPQTGKRTIAVGRCLDGKAFVITSGHPSLEPEVI